MSLVALGVLAQMVERMLCKYKVAGSMPVNSTLSKKNVNSKRVNKGFRIYFYRVFKVS